ncbi:Ankyrin and HET domain protein [Cordyceps fumosorosea ARSEF 2679]|uniref:Ankyrin and HET domain protein n=1 Tax=Cordyceps fumosorosea (strain ARSEF 2679) TaxID=1081104 RepID=A0A167S5W6_CORFA|nr:Ankyrin and HET domain protein [Cordyceps fumosorosea ARSEF 2679]OAA59289.1 Ankyrin and HET domain protein [Cordyceps fumosorosea ARSEF 2679]
MDLESLLEYRHSKLPSTSSIRLLERLDSATTEGHLTFKVHTRHINESVLRYHCLSYTWGNPFAHGNGFEAGFEAASEAYAASEAARVPVVLDGKLFYVQRNLQEALRTIPATAYMDRLNRHDTTDGEQGVKDLERAASSAADPLPEGGADRLIWADAICIDQSDIVEKSAQVDMMDRIYSNAGYVLAWLGPEDEHTGRGLQAANILTTHLDAFEASRISPWLGHDRERYLEAGIPHLARADWDALASIYQRQWFRRAWVVQEAVLARVLLVYVGGWPVPWSDLGTLAHALRRQEGRRGSSRGTRYEPTSGAGVSVEWNAAEMFRWRESMGVTRREESAQRLFCLGGLVDAFWTFRATEPADKIFSVYGLINAFAEDDGGRRATDYGRSVESVYTNATRRIIREQGSLEVLSRSLYSTGRRAGLPGWVPDYSVPAINPIPSTFAASKGLRFELSVDSQEDDDDPQLRVRGMRLGTLSRVAGRQGTGPLDKFTFNPKWFSMLLSLKDLPVCGGRRKRPALAELLWRTLCMDMTYGGFLSATDPGAASAPDEYREQFASFVLLTLMALADRRVLEKNGVDLDDAPAVSAWDAAAYDPFQEDLALALRDLDAIIARDEESAKFMPPSDLVVQFWNDVRCTMVRCTPDEGEGSARDFTVPRTVLEGSSRCVGAGRVCTESRMFRRCFGFASAYAVALGYRQLVAVDDINLGLAPLPAGAGDEVWILPGLASPAVLRRTEEDGVFSFIGCCYIHGLMHGQAVDEAEAKGEKLVDVVMM